MKPQTGDSFSICLSVLQFLFDTYSSISFSLFFSTSTSLSLSTTSPTSTPTFHDRLFPSQHTTRITRHRHSPSFYFIPLRHHKRVTIYIFIALLHFDLSTYLCNHSLYFAHHINPPYTHTRSFKFPSLRCSMHLACEHRALIGL